MKKQKKKTNPRFNIVLDSYALLAYFFNEPTAEQVSQLLKEAEKGRVNLYLSEINLGQVYYRVWKKFSKSKAVECLRLIQTYSIQLVPISREVILEAASYKARYSPSYADSFAIALALSKNCPVVTNDPEFQNIDGLEIIKLTSSPLSN